MLLMPLMFLALATSGDLESPTSAEFCGRCHQAILGAWRLSAHAQAMESRLFQDALEAAKVLGDTRLAPDEKRTESFSFPIARGSQTRVTATLRYFYSPFART